MGPTLFFHNGTICKMYTSIFDLDSLEQSVFIKKIIPFNYSADLPHQHRSTKNLIGVLLCQLTIFPLTIFISLFLFLCYFCVSVCVFNSPLSYLYFLAITQIYAFPVVIPLRCGSLISPSKSLHNCIRLLKCSDSNKTTYHMSLSCEKNLYEIQKRTQPSLQSLQRITGECINYKIVEAPAFVRKIWVSLVDQSASLSIAALSD